MTRDLALYHKERIEGGCIKRQRQVNPVIHVQPAAEIEPPIAHHIEPEQQHMPSVTVNTYRPPRISEPRPATPPYRENKPKIVHRSPAEYYLNGSDSIEYPSYRVGSPGPTRPASSQGKGIKKLKGGSLQMPSRNSIVDGLHAIERLYEQTRHMTFAQFRAYATPAIPQIRELRRLLLHSTGFHELDGYYEQYANFIIDNELADHTLFGNAIDMLLNPDLEGYLMDD